MNTAAAKVVSCLVFSDELRRWNMNASWARSLPPGKEHFHSPPAAAVPMDALERAILYVSVFRKCCVEESQLPSFISCRICERQSSVSGELAELSAHSLTAPTVQMHISQPGRELQRGLTHKTFRVLLQTALEKIFRVLDAAEDNEKEKAAPRELEGKP